jgi:hypothetical protein
MLNWNVALHMERHWLSFRYAVCSKWCPSCVWFGITALTRSFYKYCDPEGLHNHSFSIIHYTRTLNLKDNSCSPACILWFDSLLMRKGCNPSFLSRLNRGKVEGAGDKPLRSKGNLACLQEYTLLHTHQFQGGHGNWFRDELFLQWKPTSPLSARRHFVAIIYRAFRKREGGVKEEGLS